MKKVLLPFLMIGLISCGTHKSKVSHNISELTKAQNKREFYLANITEEILFRHRCDKLTFIALLSAFGTVQDLSKFQYPVDGRYNRDRDSCFPDDLNGDGQPDSKSTVSRDSYIMLVHHWLSTGDLESLEKAIAYAEDNWFTVGEGPSDYTNITPVMPLMYKAKKHLAKSLNLFDSDEEPGIWEKQFQSFRGHLLAMYIYALGRIDGTINDQELWVVKKLVEENPESPMYKALLHRFTDGNQTEALAILNNESIFPSDKVPTDDGLYGWGSCGSVIYFLTTLAIIEGK